MQRDMDLVRDLLLRIDADNEMNGQREFMFETPEELGFSGRSVEELAYHIELLIEAGFVKGQISLGMPLHVISKLTWNGHEFLDNIRDEGIWGKTKKRLSGLSSVGLSVVAEIAKAEIKKHLGLP
jgi:hypothetical protein